MSVTNATTTNPSGNAKGKKVVIGIIAVATVAVIGIFAIRNPSKSVNRDVVKIGAILPLTGAFANMGQENRAGIELAVEKINRNGRRIEVVYEDSKGEAKTSVSAMKKLETQNINKVILSTSATVSPILEMYKNNKDFFFVANCLKAGVLNDTSNAIRVFFAIEGETIMMTDYILKNKFKRVSILKGNTEGLLAPAESLQNKLIAINPAIIFHEQTFEFSDTDFRTKFVSVRNFNPDILVILSYADQFEQITRHLVEQNIDYPILAHSGFGTAAENEFYKDLEIMNNIVFPAPKFVLTKNHPENIKLFNDLKEKYNFLPNWNVLYFYDTIMVMAENLEYSNENSEFIRAVCSKEYQGITGKIAFDSAHDLKPDDLVMVNFVEGNYKLVAEFDAK